MPAACSRCISSAEPPDSGFLSHYVAVTPHLSLPGGLGPQAPGPARPSPGLVRRALPPGPELCPWSDCVSQASPFQCEFSHRHNWWGGGGRVGKLDQTVPELLQGSFWDPFSLSFLLCLSSFLTRLFTHSFTNVQTSLLGPALSLGLGNDSDPLCTLGSSQSGREGKNASRQLWSNPWPRSP